MTTTCPVCGKQASSSRSNTCDWCLLNLGLSGVAATQSGARRSSDHRSASGAPDRFLREGVLPRFGDYELLSEIARGGMGVVYRAQQRSLNRPVAVKMILAGQLATPESVQRFRLEAEAAARLHHPGIVPIYEIGEHETQHFFSMKLIEGESLAQCLPDFRLRGESSLSERREQQRCIADLLTQVARALEFAHQRGVLHRDLKPSNILIDEEGRPHLTDFGLAKLTGREAGGLTLSNAVLGTPGYLAPEQAAGRLDQVTTSADVYGLGATLYELLTGRPPFVGTTVVETMWMTIHQDPAAPRQVTPAVPRDLETIALRCLEKAPERRYASAGAVADELERFLRNEPILARPITRREHVWRWCRRNPWVALLTFALTTAILVGSGTALWQWGRAQQANVVLAENVAHLQWSAIDVMLERGQAAQALAHVALMLRKDPADARAAMFAMSLLEQRRFPLPRAPQIRHPEAGELSVARLSPDGQTIATASFDGTTRLWNSATSEQIGPPLKHGAAVTWAEFSPDGTLLASCSEDGTARVWDPRTGQPRGDPIPHDGPVLKLQFSRDGKSLLTRTARAVFVVDVASRRVRVGPLANRGRVLAARILPDGRSLFTAEQAGKNSRVSVWDPQTGKERAHLSVENLRGADLSNDQTRAVLLEGGRCWLTDFPTGENRVEIDVASRGLQGVVFGETGRSVAGMTFVHTARVWDARSGLPMTPELPHFFLLEGAAFTHNDSRLLTWGDDALAQNWDVATGKAVSEPLRHAHRVLHAEAKSLGEEEVILTAVSHLKGRSESTRTGGAQLWRIHTAGNRRDLFFGIDHAGHDGGRLSPDGRRIAIATTKQEITVYDSATGTPICGPLPVRGGAWLMHFTADSQRLFAATSRGQVSVWLIPEGRPLFEPVELSTTFQPSEITRDGKRIATGSTDGMVRLWDPETGKSVREMRHGAELNSLAFSPDGQTLASAGEDRVVRVWNVATGRVLHELRGHQNEVMSVAFTPDGARIATASLDFTGRVWDTDTGRHLFTLPHQGEVVDVACSPDGRFVATASRDRTAVLWSLDTGRLHSRAMTHQQAVRNVRFSPDGQQLLTLDFRGLRLWDVETCHPLTVHLEQPTQGGTGFQGVTGKPAFAPDGRAVLLAADNYEARLWHLSVPPVGTPTWFPDFLEAVARQRLVPGTDRPELVPAKRLLELQQQIQSSPATDFYTGWAREWLTNARTSGK